MVNKFISKLFLAIFFVAAGTLHFVWPGFYLKIMPESIPFPMAMVYISGVLEIVLGLLVLPDKTRRAAGWALVLLLIAVFPANIHLAMHPETLPNIPAWLEWARLPFQGLFIFWVYKAAL